MKAVTINASGASQSLRYADVDEPKIHRDNDVVVKLIAAAVNRIDVVLSRGGATDGLPQILGADGAGTVVAAGAAVRNVRSGDPVCLYPFYGCGDCRFCAADHESLCRERQLLGMRQDGTYAEFVRVPAKNCFPVPAGLSFEEAAAFPLVYVMAWHMLMSRAQLKPGESVLILGAGGGIATAALQLAGAAHARIIVASGNEKKLLAAQKCGAPHVIDLRRSELANAVRGLTGKRGVDMVVNCVGAATWAQSLACLARGGRLVTCGAVAGARAKTDLRRVFWNHLRILAASSATRQDFLRLLDFFADSKRKPILDRVFPLRDAHWAHQRLENREQFGKIVLRTDA